MQSNYRDVEIVSETADETMTGRTTRSILFSDKTAKVFTCGARKPAGTLVYVGAHSASKGTVRIRIPGTLLTQDVYLTAVEPE